MNTRYSEWHASAHPPDYLRTYVQCNLVHTESTCIILYISIRALFNIHICILKYKKRTGNGKAILSTKEMFKIQCPIFIIQCVVDFRLRCRNKKKINNANNNNNSSNDNDWRAEKIQMYTYIHTHIHVYNILWYQRVMCGERAKRNAHKWGC